MGKVGALQELRLECAVGYHVWYLQQRLHFSVGRRVICRPIGGDRRAEEGADRVRTAPEWKEEEGSETCTLSCRQAEHLGSEHTAGYFLTADLEVCVCVCVCVHVYGVIYVCECMCVCECMM